MILFTKTCARDAERVFYQALAARRFVRDMTKHIVVVERDELKAAPALHHLREYGVQVDVLEEVMPRLADVANPYLRQQLVKLYAPVRYGQSLVQIDSDMCPVAPCSLSWVFGPTFMPTWCYNSAPSHELRDTLRDWAATYVALFGARPLWPWRSYMLEQHGWHLDFGAAAALWREIDVDCAERIYERTGGRFSEYQFFGWWAHERSYAYNWHDISLYGLHNLKSWVEHYTSSEPLTEMQRRRLRELAGGVACPS